MASSTAAPEAIGPYSQAVVAGDVIYCSGQIPLDPASGTLVGGDIEAQTERALQNLEALLRSMGSSLSHVIRTTVYMIDLRDYDAMNSAYARRFTEHFPARVAVEVQRLPRDAMIEIDCIATVARDADGRA
jgi:2-iminobutanoate/2-iminopropanoate deaminase